MVEVDSAKKKEGHSDLGEDKAIDLRMPVLLETVFDSKLSSQNSVCGLSGKVL